jgi:hypothetical protein
MFRQMFYLNIYYAYCEYHVVTFVLHVMTWLSAVFVVLGLLFL